MELQEIAQVMMTEGREMEGAIALVPHLDDIGSIQDEFLGCEVQGHVVTGAGFSFGGRRFLLADLEELPAVGRPWTRDRIQAHRYTLELDLDDMDAGWTMDGQDQVRYERHLAALEEERQRETRERQEREAFRDELLAVAQEHGYQQGWVWHRLREEYGIQIASELLPRDDG